MDQAEHFFTLFRRLLWYQAHKGIDCQEARELRQGLGPAMKSIEGLYVYIDARCAEIDPDGQFKAEAG